MQDDILALAFQVSQVTQQKVAVIEEVMKQTKILALNAQLEASRAGSAGAAFSVVAQEMGNISKEISQVAAELRGSVTANIHLLENAGENMAFGFRGTRFTDLARTAVEIIDRNLYERSCDVRWWATDSAIVNALETPDPAACAHASARLATILASYTVYLDLWVADLDGKVIATGRPRRYPQACGLDVSRADWFQGAMRTRDGTQFHVRDIERNPVLDGELSATYSTAVRRQGDVRGEPIGALGIFFDWGPQAMAVLKGVGLSEAEQANARVMILNARHQIIASSDGGGVLSESFPITTEAGPSGFYRKQDRIVAYAATPGYETYRGLGWYGCIEGLLPVGLEGRQGAVP